MDNENPSDIPEDVFGLQKFDKNHNGKLDPDERAAWEAALVAKYDVNHDGKLNEQELSHWKHDKAYLAQLVKEATDAGLTTPTEGNGLQKEEPGKAPGDVLGLDKFDTNHNGKLDPDERKAWEEKVLAKYDKDKNGRLDRIELMKFRNARDYQQKVAKQQAEENAGPPPSGTGLESEEPGTSPQDPLGLSKFDKNGNGKLDPDERVAWEKAMLEKFDVNHNGHLDPSELHVWKHGVGHMEEVAAGKKAPREPKTDSDKSNQSKAESTTTSSKAEDASHE